MNRRTVSTIAACAAAAALAASCTLEEHRASSLERPISFRAFAENVTRATPVTQPGLQDFDVVAFDAENVRDFYDTFTLSDAATYASAKEHLWPGDGSQLTFLAFNRSMLEEAGLLSVNASGANYLDNFTDPSNSKLPQVTIPADAKSHVDFIVARTQASEAEGSGTTSPTPLNFRHALAQVKVMARNANPNYKVEVVGVKLAYMNNVSDFTFPPSTNSDSHIGSASDNYFMGSERWSINSNGSGSITTTAPEQIVAEGSNLNGSYPSFMYQITTGDEPNLAYSPLRLPISGESAYENYQDLMEGNSFFVIPQVHTKWTGGTAVDGSYISILCKISKYTGVGSPNAEQQAGSDNWKQAYPSNDTYSYAFASVPVDVNWTPGKCCTYRLEFFGTDGGGGIVDPDPVDPVDPDPTDPEVDPDPGEGGEELFGGPITFSVTVDEWVNTNTDQGMPREGNSQAGTQGN